MYILTGVLVLCGWGGGGGGYPCGTSLSVCVPPPASPGMQLAYNWLYLDIVFEPAISISFRFAGPCVLVFQVLPDFQLRC